MRLRGMRRRLYLLAYDKPSVQKRALKLRRSFDEVKRALEERGGRKQ